MYGGILQGDSICVWHIHYRVTLFVYGGILQGDSVCIWHIHYSVTVFVYGGILQGDSIFVPICLHGEPLWPLSLRQVCMFVWEYEYACRKGALKGLSSHPMHHMCD